MKFLGFVHDIGKATPAFQVKKSYNDSGDLDSDILEMLVKSGFDKIDTAALELMNIKKTPHTVAGEALLEEFGCDASIGAIIGSHHGRTTSEEQEEDIDIHEENYFQVEMPRDKQEKDIVENWRNLQLQIFKLALEKSGYSSQNELPTRIKQPQAVLLEGLLIMADWLSSSEDFKDKMGNVYPLFPLVDLSTGYKDIDHQERIESAMSLWDVSGTWIGSYTGVNETYKKRWGYTPHLVQKKMSQAIENSERPELVIIENTMGGGKTEIAMVAAEQLAKANKRNGVFWGLPTQATSDAMFSRFNSWISNIAEEENESFSVSLMHGNAKLNSEYSRLPDAIDVSYYEDFAISPEATNIFDEDGTVKNDDGAITVNSWFTGKKTILTKFSVGTIDNLLLMGLKQKHLFLRHFGFADKVVVLDEVHAYDVYMSSYLFKALEWLGAYHVPVVILSATLPKEKRVRIVESYMSGKKEKTKSNNWKKTSGYPLLTILNADNVVDQFNDFEKVEGVDVIVDRFNGDEEQVVAKVMNDLKDGGVAGIIVNTVLRAQKIAKLISKDTQKILLHSAFIAPERKRIEKELLSKIGKKGQRPKKLVVIGTQVLEQSLDIDFDILYTDIAPIDLILQRAGRLQRHRINDINRPNNLKKPRLTVMEATDEGYGKANEAIYSKYLLLKSDYFLKDVLNLPNDIEPLVQSVYDSKTDEEVPNIAEAKEDFDGENNKSESKASDFQIEKPKYCETLHGWLQRGNYLNIRNYQQWINASVRDIEETLEVILLKKTKQCITLINGLPIDRASPKEIAQQTIRIPNSVTSHKIKEIINFLEKQTSRNYPSWQKNAFLKGELALTLDECNRTNLEEWSLEYSLEYGLLRERRDAHEEE